MMSIACNSGNESNDLSKSQIENQQNKCTDKFCKGTYIGKEFISGADIAHQHSNKMSAIVGDKLVVFSNV